jgi:uncharacterized protein YceK
MIKMKFQYILIIILLSGCSEIAVQNNSEGKKETINTETTYTLINDDLYQNASGELFFRIIDRSAADNPDNPKQGIRIDYIDYLRFDTIINGKNTYTTPKISDVVDAETFREIEVPDSLNYRIFKDKNYKYTLISQADGGVLHVMK